MRKYLNFRANTALGLIFAFLVNAIGPISITQADDFSLPAPGVMVGLSPEFNPPVLKGIKVDPQNPLHFEFILDKGEGRVIASAAKQSQQEQLKIESAKLIKYFLAGLTIPEDNLWVNLSPYEKNRIIPQSFGLTEMGRDLLAEDYMLKQITASLIYPQDKTGKKFWKRIYQEAAQKYGTTNIPINTFNKVWILPQKAVIYENMNAGTAYVKESKLKVMLEEDYLALQKHNVETPFMASHHRDAINGVSTKNILQEIIIPELTREVNDNKNFAPLRQVYNSLILAYWFKKKIKDSILAQVYENKNKLEGLRVRDKNPLSLNPDAIYQRYLQAFKKGVFNYIKEERDNSFLQSEQVEGKIVSRKYFSGGTSFNAQAMSSAAVFTRQKPQHQKLENLARIKVNLAMLDFPLDKRVNTAMKSHSADDARKELEYHLKVLKINDSNIQIPAIVGIRKILSNYKKMPRARVMKALAGVYGDRNFKEIVRAAAVLLLIEIDFNDPVVQNIIKKDLSPETPPLILASIISGIDVENILRWDGSPGTRINITGISEKVLDLLMTSEHEKVLRASAKFLVYSQPKLERKFKARGHSSYLDYLDQLAKLYVQEVLLAKRKYWVYDYVKEKDLKNRVEQRLKKLILRFGKNSREAVCFHMLLEIIASNRLQITSPFEIYEGGMVLEGNNEKLLRHILDHHQEAVEFLADLFLRQHKRIVCLGDADRSYLWQIDEMSKLNYFKKSLLRAVVEKAGVDYIALPFPEVARKNLEKII